MQQSAPALPAVYVLWVAAAVIAFLKGKPWMAFGSLLVPLFWVAAFRLAKPNSWWARHNYDEVTLRRSIKRFPLPLEVSEKQFLERARVTLAIRDTKAGSEWGTHIHELARDESISVVERKRLLTKIANDPRTTDATQYEIERLLEGLSELPA